METTKFVPSPTSDVWLGVAQLGVRGEPPLRRGVGEPIMAFTGDFGQGNGSKHCSWPQRFFCKYLMGHDLLYNYSIIVTSQSVCVCVNNMNWQKQKYRLYTGTYMWNASHACTHNILSASNMSFPQCSWPLDVWTKTFRFNQTRGKVACR